MKNFSQIKQWSNLFFLIPLTYAISKGVWWYSVIIGAVFIISSLYHYTHENKYLRIDAPLAFLIIFSNIVLVYLGNFKIPYFLYVCAGVALAGFFYFRQNKHGYNVNHGLYHIVSAGICLFSLCTYLL